MKREVRPVSAGEIRMFLVVTAFIIVFSLLMQQAYMIEHLKEHVELLRQHTAELEIMHGGYHP